MEEMPYEVFYVECSLNGADERAIEEIPKKEHYKTKKLALMRVRELSQTKNYHSILLAHGPDPVLSGFRLQLEADLEQVIK
jgi:hypothetical protein